MIVFVTQDLMMQSSAVAASRPLGIRVVAVPSTARAVEQISKENVELLIVDLQTRGLEISALIHQLPANAGRPKIIAFAQHVEEELLRLAEAEAIHQVMTRGQFNRRLPEILQQVASEDNTSADG